VVHALYSNDFPPNPFRAMQSKNNFLAVTNVIKLCHKLIYNMYVKILIKLSHALFHANVTVPCRHHSP